ncbi:hypothetical protein HanRHA438_Chr03g0115551 [Helianthus annuus]|nr:hypothetical protein HanRHA438_Chr03g0115551 [Helianthus annuus]
MYVISLIRNFDSSSAVILILRTSKFDSSSAVIPILRTSNVLNMTETSSRSV